VWGKETLAIALGKERTLNFLFLATLIFMAVPAPGRLGASNPSLGYALALCGLLFLGIPLSLPPRLAGIGPFLETLVEGNMILAGMLAFLWDPFNRIF